MNLRLLPEADSEVLSATLWYDDQQAGLGAEFLVALETSLNAIKTNAVSLPLLESYSGPHVIRRHLVKRFPYSVIFTICNNEIIVVAVAHTRRRPFFGSTD